MAKYKNKTLQTVVDVAGSIDPSLKKTVEGAVKGLDKINLKAVAIGAAVGGITVATAKAVIDAGKYLSKLGSEFDQVSDTIRIGTGATGKALEALNKDFEEVYKSVPTSMEDASKAIADYNTRLGLTGSELQSISKQALQVSSMLGDDLDSVIEQSSKAFQQWGVSADQMGAAMDFVFKASQSAGTGFTDLLSRVQQFGPQMQEMGYSIESATALIGQLDKAGVNTDEVLGAMKKSVAALGKQGVKAGDGLAIYYDKILNAKDATKAASIASEIFGSKAGSTMAAAIRDGTLAVGAFTAELEANQETIGRAAEDTYDFNEKLQMLRQSAEIALRPLAETMFDSLNDLMPVVTEIFETLIPLITDCTTTLAPLIKDIIGSLLPTLKSIIPIIQKLATKVIGKIIPPILRIVDAILPALISVLDALAPIIELVTDLLGPILSIVEGLLKPIMALIKNAVSPLLNVLLSLIQTVLKPLSPILEFLGSMFSDYLSGCIESVVPVIDSLKGILSGIIDFITNVFTGNWEGAWEAVKSIFKNIINGIVGIFSIPINFIINGINSFLKGINGIQIPDWVPGVGGKGFNIPLIPNIPTQVLAKGGFTEGIAIAGEAGQEAVLSFDPAYNRQNRAYWAEAGARLGIADESSLGILSQGSGSTTYDLGGVVFSPQITISGSDIDGDALLRKIKEYEPEFLDFLVSSLERRHAGAYGTANSWIY